MKSLVRLTVWLDEEQDTLTVTKVLGIHWLSPMDRFLDHDRQDIKMLPIRYEVMKTVPLEVMERIFKYCGVEVGDRMVLEDALKRDSQAGSALGRDFTQDKQFPSKQKVMQEYLEILARHPVIDRPDFIFPGTLTLT